MTPNHASPVPPARNRRRAARTSWRPLTFVLGAALVALIATIIFVACGSSSTPAPTGSTPAPTPTAAPTGPTVTANPQGTIAAGVTVNGVDIGGLNRDDAQVKLLNDLPDVSTGKLTINIGSLSQDVTYASVSRAYDINAILDAALTSAAGALAPKMTYDANALAAAVNGFVATAQAEPINATISYVNGEYVMTPAADGRSVDGNAVLSQAGALMANGNAADQTLDVQVTTIPADISSAAAQAAIARAQAVTGQPLTITVGVSTFTVDTSTLRSWVTLEQTSPGQWTLSADQAAVGAYVGTIKAQVDQPPVEASWHFDGNGNAVVVPGQTGYVVDAATSTAQIVTALSGAQPGQPVGPVTLTAVATEPNFTTADAQAAISKIVLLGTWTTHYIPSHFNGNGINVRRPAEIINGTVIQPGKLFDFVAIAGPITVANGYTDGAAIIHGKTKGEGVLGGGLCSASTTMFNAALRAGFQMGARYNHYYYISRYPIGLDATIWINGNAVKDMTFTNDSKYPIVIRSINKARAVTFQVWGVSDGRTVSLTDPIVTNQQPASQYYQFTDTLPARQQSRTEFGADGFNAVVTRTVRDANGNVIHSDTYFSNYGKVDGIVLLGRYPGDPPSGTLIPNNGPPPGPPGPTPTPTHGPPTPTPSHTPNPTGGPTPTPSHTPSHTPTPTPTNPPPTPTPTPDITAPPPTPTPTPTPTAT